ncbi:indolepyruvate oxidoreductase subunit beta family protein [Pseudoduganella namucuonensis]|uniref:Indolepyruvate ferredoxin oxidoreductase beta subunit n=1 Tax=Pseudoduganella namucuonensis TaxID=1035707 RepID=A0A1I7LH21_9BURK|nr:indolepyruvate oxidoreductase subunit beta family protein [Pseudoduganella namucuonensis]SFV08977.1 indolepyruvate ferredoxin oxidoreductase beta subunit [Pseudoduganella namucuonensis]
MHDTTFTTTIRQRTPVKPAPAKPIGIAILAMGGEGGGVLADWIVDLAEHEGYPAQSTSVPGVAQRTGTTIYYVEFLPRARSDQPPVAPVLSLMPAAGDVDIVIASELMEMGRAVQRGLVTADKTTLIASTNRVYSMTEKSAMGDGRVDPAPFIEAARGAAKRFVCGDFAALAERSGSVISAALLGALAGTGALPFSREQFEAAIRRAGVGVEGSLKAFGAGFELAQKGPPAGKIGAAAAHPAAVERTRRKLKALDARIDAEFPAAAGTVLRAGVRRLADYQHLAYAEQYLARLLPIRDVDRRAGDGASPLLVETARHLALWMSYEDTVRVADLKIRATRFQRVGKEVKVKDDQLLHINEYFHPRVDEIADTLPAWLGKLLMRPGRLRDTLERMTAKGRVVRTTSLAGFLLLYGVAGLRGWRPVSLRYRREHAEMENWLGHIGAHAAQRYPLALEIAACQRLVKGYGDTHARGMRNFKLIEALLPRMAASADGPERMRQLREAALKDEEGAQLAALLREWQWPAPAPQTFMEKHHA